MQGSSATPTKANRASECAPAQLVPAAEGLGAKLQPCRSVEQAPRTSPAGCVQSTDPSCLAAMTTLDSTAWGTRARKPGLKGRTLLLRQEADRPVRAAIEGTAPAWTPPATPTGPRTPAQVAWGGGPPGLAGWGAEESGWGGGPPGLAGWEGEEESGLLQVLNVRPCIRVGTLLPKAGGQRPEPASARGPSPLLPGPQAHPPHLERERAWTVS